MQLRIPLRLRARWSGDVRAGGAILRAGGAILTDTALPRQPSHVNQRAKLTP